MGAPKATDTPAAAAADNTWKVRGQGQPLKNASWTSGSETLLQPLNIFQYIQNKKCHYIAG